MSKLGLGLLVVVVVACTGPNPHYRGPVGTEDASGDQGGRGGSKVSPPDGGTGGALDLGGFASGGSPGGLDAEPMPDAGPLADLAPPPPDVPIEALPETAPVVDTNPPPPPDLAPEAAPPDVAPLPVMLATGLEAHWKFDETTGRVVKDSAKTNNGTYVGDAVWLPGGPTLVGRSNLSAVSLGGNGDYVNFTVASLPALGVAKTISLWLRTADATTGMHNALALVNPTLPNGTRTGRGLQIGTFGGKVAMWQYGLDAPILVAGDAVLNEWVQVVYTFDGTRHRLYRRGVEVQAPGSTVAAHTGAVTSARVGVYDQLFEFFKGQVDDVRIWSRALNAAEIQALARGE